MRFKGKVAEGKSVCVRKGARFLPTGLLSTCFQHLGLGQDKAKSQNFFELYHTNDGNPNTSAAFPRVLLESWIWGRVARIWSIIPVWDMSFQSHSSINNNTFHFSVSDEVHKYFDIWCTTYLLPIFVST